MYSVQTPLRNHFQTVLARREEEALLQARGELRSLPPPYLPEISTGCQEIRSISDLREFLSTNRQAWLLFYDAEPASQSFKRTWAKFSAAVTLGGSAAVVGAIDAVAQVALTEMTQFEIPHAAAYPLIRRYTMGAHFERSDVTRKKNVVTTTVTPTRHGASHPGSVITSAKPYYGKKRFDTMKDVAQNVFRSRVVSSKFSDGREILPSLKEMRMLANAMSSKRVAVLVMPVKAGNTNNKQEGDEETDDFDSYAAQPPLEAYEFAFHWISRQFHPAEISDEPGLVDAMGVHDGKLAFAIVEANSHVAKELFALLTAEERAAVEVASDSAVPSLIIYEKAGEFLNQKESKKDAEEEATRFRSLLFSSCPLRDVRNVARHLRNGNRPSPTAVAKQAVECATLRECFEKHPDEPFVVRNTPEILAISTNVYEHVVKRCLDIRGPGTTHEFVESVDQLSGDHTFFGVAESIELWLNDSLPVNIIDGPGARGDGGKGNAHAWFVFPEVMLERIFEAADKLLILSPSKSYTSVHFDPPRQGTTFQQIFKGQKRFEMIHPKYHKTLKCDLNEPEEGGVCKLRPDQLPNPSDVEVISAYVGPNDFVAWPPAWVHQVWTDDACFAVNGYLDLDKKREKVNMNENLGQW